ncbi:MAG TPA: hypothetical protein VGH06_06820 [Candidatus Udaeobacter sp.]|jgi:hypothetical protein
MNDFQFARRRRRNFPGFTIGAIISFALCIASATTDAAQVDSGLEGKWSGKIQIPGEELVLIVDLAHGANWTGSATLPGLNLKGAPLTQIDVEGADVSFGIQALTGPTIEPPKIKARLTDKKLVGDFIQGGNTARMVLEKAGPPEVEEPLRSTPVAKEFEGEWKGNYELLGYPRKVTLKLQNHAPQPASAEFVIVGRKVNNVPVDRITQHGNFITIESSAFGLTYEGRLENGEIRGTVLQGPIEVALTLRRS